MENSVPAFTRNADLLFVIQSCLYDSAVIAAACCRLQLPEPVHGVARIFSSAMPGLIVQLPGWLYPIVINVTTGDIYYDNFHGRWGDQQKLEQFLQACSAEKTNLERDNG